MSITLISDIKQKNNGQFFLVDSDDIDVSAGTGAASAFPTTSLTNFIKDIEQSIGDIESGDTTAGSAEKLDVADTGDADTPVYFEDGVPKACTSLDLNTSGSAAKLATAGTIQIDLTSDSSATYTNGGNITPGVSGILDAPNGGTGNATGRVQIGQKSGVALGTNATSEGNDTQATGDYTHAEGRKTYAGGNYSHAEGNGSVARGESSHAEGDGSMTIGNSSHAEGYQTTAQGDYSHIEGMSTGLIGLTAVDQTNEELISLWETQRYSLAKGAASHAEGVDTLALGDGSHAEGSGVIASGNYSHAEGRKYGDAHHIASGEASHVEGLGNQALDVACHAEGSNNIVGNGSSSHVEGNSNIAYGQHIHVEGSANIVGTEDNDATDYLTGTHVEGVGNTVGNGAGGSHAEGGYNTITNPTGGSMAAAWFAHAEGSYNTVSAYSAHAEGHQTTASGDYSHAEGTSTNKASAIVDVSSDNDTIIEAWNVNTKQFLLAKGTASHAEGCDTLALGAYSHAEGDSTRAIGDYSHAEGFYTTAQGMNSHAEGRDSEAIGWFSHAEGNLTFATGECSHAEGAGTSAIGKCSHAGGQNTIAASESQTAIGKYNIEDTENTYALIIGNGTADDARSNAFGVDWSGNTYISGKLAAGGIGTYMITPGDTENTNISIINEAQNATLSINNKPVPTLTTAQVTLSAGASPWTVTTDTDGNSLSGRITASSTIFVSPNPTSFGAYLSANVRCSDQGDGSLTFVSSGDLSANVNVNVAIFN